MRNRLIPRSFSLQILSASIWAAFSHALVTAEGGFYSASQLPLKPKNLDRALDASLYLEREGSWCSSAALSRNGYVLTNIHCILGCLSIHDALMEAAQGTRIEGYRTIPERAQGRICTGIEAEGMRNPKVVFVGQGFAEFDDRKVLEIPRELLREAKRTNEDFAILKFSPPRSSHQRPGCIPASRNALAVGDRIWVVGYPDRNLGRDGYHSNGVSEYVSYGSVSNSIRENAFFLKSRFSQRQIDLLEEFYSLPHQLISDADSFPGNSGSMMIDQNGELVGVLSAAAVPTSEAIQTQYVANSTVGVRISHIMRRITEELGAPMTEEIFSCP